MNDAQEQVSEKMFDLVMAVGDTASLLGDVMYHGKPFNEVAVLQKIADILGHATEIAFALGFSLGDIGAVQESREDHHELV
jgi:ABC-type hemin transport system substrate-binding protein